MPYDDDRNACIAKDGPANEGVAKGGGVMTGEAVGATVMGAAVVAGALTGGLGSTGRRSAGGAASTSSGLSRPGSGGASVSQAFSAAWASRTIFRNSGSL